MYLIGHRRSCRPHGTRICGTLKKVRPMRLVSSCNAPNGQSQPQNAPRAQNSIATATADHRMKTRGDSRK